MALLPKAANTEGNNQGADSFEAIPAGDYLAHITKSEMKANKAKTGHFLLLIHTILEGEHKGSSIFVRLNLDNPNPKAVEIANKELNSICQACDKEGVEDSEDLHLVPMCIRVAVEPASSQWPASNNIKKWMPESEYEGGAVGTDEPTVDEPEVVEPNVVEEPAIEAEVVEENEKLPWE